MAPKSHTQTHVPLGARQVEIIRRLSNVTQLPVTQIAKAVDRNKSTIYAAFDKKWWPVKRGRKKVFLKVTKDYWLARQLEDNYKTIRRQLEDN